MGDFATGDRVRVVKRTDHYNGIEGVITRLGSEASYWNLRHHVEVAGGGTLYFMPDELERLSSTSGTGQEGKGS